MQRLWCILLSVQLSLALNGQDKSVTASYPGVLHCGHLSLQFIADLPSQEAASPPALITWDGEGLLHRLRDDPDCGTWVGTSLGNSVVLEASYSGCYVTEQDSHYVMPVGVEGTDAAGHKTVTKMRVLKCPMVPQDSPGADLCNTVPVWDRMSCAPSPVTQADCEALGCCYNSEENSCYYGNTVTSHCSQDGQFSIAVSQNVTSPPLLLNSVRLVFGNDSECNPVMATQAFILFQFPFTSCGTVRQMTRGQAVYENQLIATRDIRTWSRGSITRDSIFRLRVSCSYSVSGNVLPASVQVFTLPPPLSDIQPGPLTLELQIAKDKNYSSYYTTDDYPVVKFLRDPIYVEVSILHREDPYLGLLLHHCWATPSTDHLYELQWPILVNGCPYSGDNYRTQLIPVPETEGLPFPAYYQRFSLFTFAFVDSKAKQALKGPVYLHCSASLCRPTGTPSCVAVTCPPGSRSGRSSDIHFQNNTASTSSKGPMILLQVSKDSSEKLPQYSRSPVDSQVLWVAGLSGTLILGALLVSYLVIRKRK